MKVTAYKTPIIALHDSLYHHLNQALPSLQEGDVVAVTSKIVSICGGYIRYKDPKILKVDVIYEEADAYLKSITPHPYGAYLTLKHHLLIPSAGIDESNADGAYYILYPPHPFLEAEAIWTYLKARDGLERLGVILTDSHTTPLRRGVTGIGLAWCGFRPIVNKIGEQDLFGKPLKMTTINVVDALSVTAVFAMGEGREQTPIAVIRDPSQIHYCHSSPNSTDFHEFFISLDDDMYADLFKKEEWCFKT